MNGLWILTRNWVVFLQDMSISHSLLNVQWSSWQFSLPIRYDVSKCGMFYSQYFKNTHLNLALVTVNKMAARFFFSNGWWGELSRVLWWCAILCIFRIVLMLKAIKCSMNTYDRSKYHFFRGVYSLASSQICHTQNKLVRRQPALDKSVWFHSNFS